MTYANIVSFGKSGLRAILCLKGTDQLDDDDDEQGIKSLQDLSQNNH